MPIIAEYILTNVFLQAWLDIGGDRAEKADTEEARHNGR
jgi:hypothetical protein